MAVRLRDWRDDLLFAQDFLIRCEYFMLAQNIMFSRRLPEPPGIAQFRDKAKLFTPAIKGLPLWSFSSWQRFSLSLFLLLVPAF